ncbi:3-deoxy-7-phosphoheptulonate synthase [Furfurilactobacillus siliginis]|uniref:3-deoxy-7-phosphoheptulonate synthase n=1 Tax=Furfurilactobacillus siliginis TaxID=348151 RepID=A0A0R2LAK9_9LACO|nr:3-deoxy-7-phosphoheptulonate synthase [Furfurilactobacillus siliginis]KRN95767.1 3-deoxy-7-phosphoheptulonate synthase [Furfurilactobacillus siliginis]GEK28957.1 3-deoxy-7-phosphoheptulonate synthase [Furfurilactobacillus siliginis]
MIIILKAANQAEAIVDLQKHFGDHTDVFVHNNRVAIVGAKESDLTAAEQAAAEEIIMQHPAAVQSSRLFHPEDTVINLAHTIIGGGHFSLSAGPCSVESAEHVRKMAAVAKAGGATLLRGGAFKPRTSPYSFQGLEEDGLKFLRAAADEQGMDMITEVMDEMHVDMVNEYTDVFQIGARNMQNFSLLKAVGKMRKPVLLKRGMSGTIDDLMNAAEYIAAGGNTQIMLCERGIRTFDNKYTRNTFDVGAVSVLHELTHFPVIVDPSHAMGHTDLVTPMAVAGTAAGADGVVVEIHDDPAHAFSDGAQALKPDQFMEMAKRVQAVEALVAGWREEA